MKTAPIPDPEIALGVALVVARLNEARAQASAAADELKRATSSCKANEVAHLLKTSIGDRIEIKGRVGAIVCREWLRPSDGSPDVLTGYYIKWDDNGTKLVTRATLKAEMDSILDQHEEWDKGGGFK